MNCSTKLKIGTMMLSAAELACAGRPERRVSKDITNLRITKKESPYKTGSKPEIDPDMDFTPEEAYVADMEIQPEEIYPPDLEFLLEDVYGSEEDITPPEYAKIDYENPAVKRIKELPTYEEGFLEAVEAMCYRLDMHAHALLSVIHAETGGSFDPAIQNPSRQSRATGLIQFMPRTARALGTTVEDIQKMGQIEQLPFVEAYYQRAAAHRRPGVYRDPVSVAMAVFMPAFIGRNPSYVIVTQENTPTRYNLNRGMDLNRDGDITIQERSTRAFRFGYTTRPARYARNTRREHRQQSR